MKIILAHNYYQQPGGEDVVFHTELQMLRDYGHDVIPFKVSNDAVKTMGRLALLGNTVWNRQMSAELRRIVRAERPAIVHFHNTFPLISPAGYYAAGSGGAAVVQTLHNFRLLCPGALFYRDGKVCTDCQNSSFAWRGIVHACYRGSRLTTAVTAATHTLHRVGGTWRNAVDAYIALTPSARERFITGGLPAAKVIVKPNFVHPDPQPRTGEGGYAIFVGRLSDEKGVQTLLDAWKTIGDSIPLRIVGDGPMAELVKAAVASNPAITWLGRRDAAEIADLIGNAALLLQPSNCFETFGRVAIEAFAVGTPVVAAGHGAMADVVGTDGRLGALFTPGDPADLAKQTQRLFADRTQLTARRPIVRQEYLDKYTCPQNHKFLMDIYQTAIANRKARASKQPSTAEAELSCR